MSSSAILIIILFRFRHILSSDMLRRKNGRWNNLIEISISSYKEVNVLMRIEQISDNAFNSGEIIYVTVSEKSNRIYLQGAFTSFCDLLF